MITGEMGVGTWFLILNGLMNSKLPHRLQTAPLALGFATREEERLKFLQYFGCRHSRDDEFLRVEFLSGSVLGSFLLVF